MNGDIMPKKRNPIRRTKISLKRAVRTIRNPKAAKRVVIKERGFNYEELPDEIRKHVDKIKTARFERNVAGVLLSLSAGGLLYLITSSMKGRTPETRSTRLLAGFTGASFGASVISVFEGAKKVRKALEELGDSIKNSKNPKIQRLRKRYSYVIVDRKGNIIFTNVNRKLFGRKRVKVK